MGKTRKKYALLKRTVAAIALVLVFFYLAIGLP